MIMTERVSLTELQLIIRDSIYLSLPDFYWVTAEISELKENNAGHCYLELIEKNPAEKNVKARVRAIVWSNRFRFLKAFFEDSTKETLREGLKVLVKIKVEYHELYGLSLIISDIDPAFTIGDMAMKRQLIIKRLEQEGVFTMNKDLVFPAVPQRIAVISSRNAAGYTDFVNHLRNNSHGYVFYTALIETSLQGSETDQGVINALNIIAEQSHLFDVAVIIRGGGSQSDLSWFDSYNIAYHVTQFPLPVITGIGHEKDISVTDMVANRSLKTPTAVADLLIDSVAGAENYIIEMSYGIIESSRSIIEKNKNRIESSSFRLSPVARIMLSDVKERLSSKIMEINNTGRERIFRAALIPANQKSKLSASVKSLLSAKYSAVESKKQSILSSTLSFIKASNLLGQSLENKLQLLNPENILKRGYSITSLDGNILKNSRQIKNGDQIHTQLFEGTLRSIIIEKIDLKSE
jgi:exodeoxyribonuclease VII large subunit